MECGCFSFDPDEASSLACMSGELEDLALELIFHHPFHELAVRMIR